MALHLFSSLLSGSLFPQLNKEEENENSIVCYVPGLIPSTLCYRVPPSHNTAMEVFFSIAREGNWGLATSIRISGTH